MVTIDGEEMDDGVDEPDIVTSLGPEGCLFPGECCMPWPHYESECHTAGNLAPDRPHADDIAMALKVSEASFDTAKGADYEYATAVLQNAIAMGWTWDRTPAGGWRLHLTLK